MPASALQPHRFLVVVNRLTVPVYRSGAPGGFPVLYFHGLPSHPLESALAAPAAKELGVELIALERPGYDRMRPLDGLGIGGYARLAGRVAKVLGITRCAVLGVSGGSPSAIACAALLPGLVGAVASVGGMGASDDQVALAAMSAHLKRSLAFGRAIPLGRRLTLAVLGRLFRRRPVLPFIWLNLTGPSTDREVLDDPVVRRVLITAGAKAFTVGGRGPDRDLALFTRPWGFDPAMIRIPVRLHHGLMDETVTPAFSEGLAVRIPGAKLFTYPGEGHFSLPVRRAGEILADLLAVVGPGKTNIEGTAGGAG